MAKKSVRDIKIHTQDSMFGIDSTDILENEYKQLDTSERVIDIPMLEIEDFPHHPFKVRMDEDMAKMIESIQERGILIPTIVRPNKNGLGYQMISGHRRKFASELAELETIPAIVKNYDDDEATIVMVDSNIQRENLLPSERAYAYKMKYDALKNQGKRTDLTSCQVGTKYKKRRTDETIAVDEKESARNIQRYIRLTYLSAQILDLVDDKKISFNPAVELSFLTEEHQKILYKVIQQEETTPSLSQSQRLKELSKVNQFSEEVVFSVLSEEKPNQKAKITISNDRINKYFKRGTTPKQMEEIIVKLLEQWAKKQQKNHER